MTGNIEDLYPHFLKATGVSTDTRSIGQGNIFFALKGPNFNANKLAAQALEKGASVAVIDDPAFDNDPRCFLVEDVLQTLQKLATHHRRQFDIPFVALTGSNGKTTTKELIRDVLATKFKVLATLGNLNNHIGVPLTLLRVTAEAEIAIIEMGANHVGEIAELCEIAEPTHGLITNIGKAHLEGFGGIEGVIRGKSEMYNYLIQTGGVIFVNSKHEVLKNMAERRMKNPYYYPQKGDYYQAELLETKPGLKFRGENGEEVQTQIHGEYNFDNICTALCIGKFFETDTAESHAAIAGYVSENNRSQSIVRADKTIILDAYNANPSSMEAALRDLAGLTTSHTAVILGDMYELGETREEEHKKIGSLTGELGIDLPIFCGELMSAAAAANTSAVYCQTKEELSLYLESNVIPAGHVLVKGSRGMGLETIVDKIH
ncbi:MAG: UDP-N-acetylmuramoyl-tripeptide--D-alanyl-D-alanine ligase [Roseivirga sp.]